MGLTGDSLLLLTEWARCDSRHVEANGYANTVLLEEGEEGSALANGGGCAGNAEELRLAKITPVGEVYHRTVAYRGVFCRGLY